ncbi:MAG: hypothetical protein AAF669_02170 [Pseudomonadota bacterium]
MTQSESDYYTKIALQAARRAARQVIEQAHKNNVPIPVWKNGRVEYCLPPLDSIDRGR